MVFILKPQNLRDECNRLHKKYPTGRLKSILEYLLLEKTPKSIAAIAEATKDDIKLIYHTIQLHKNASIARRTIPIVEPEKRLTGGSKGQNQIPFLIIRVNKEYFDDNSEA